MRCPSGLVGPRVRVVVVADAWCDRARETESDSGTWSACRTRLASGPRPARGPADRIGAWRSAANPACRRYLPAARAPWRTQAAGWRCVRSTGAHRGQVLVDTRSCPPGPSVELKAAASSRTRSSTLFFRSIQPRSLPPNEPVEEPVRDHLGRQWTVARGPAHVPLDAFAERFLADTDLQGAEARIVADLLRDHLIDGRTAGAAAGERFARHQ